MMEARWAKTARDAQGAEQWSSWLGDDASERKLAIPKRLEGRRTNEFIASTYTEARDGDIIDQSSWRLANYRRNPVILDNHSYGALVGKAETIRVVDDDLRVLVLWDDSEENPRARQVARWHEEGFRKAVSVRWLTGRRTLRNKLPEDHPFYDKGRKVSDIFGEYLEVGCFLERCELLEVSSVDVPGDPKALQVRTVSDKIPDLSARMDLMQMLDEASADGKLATSEGFRAAVLDILLHAARTPGEVRTAITGIVREITPSEPAPAPDELAAWLAGPTK